MNLLHPRGVCSSSMWHGDTSLLLLTAFCCLFSSLSSLPSCFPLHVLHKLISHKYSPCPKQQLPHERGSSTAVGRTCHAPSPSPLYLYPYLYTYLCVYAKSCATRAIPCLCFINFICFPLCFPPRAERERERANKREEELEPIGVLRVA